MLQTMRNLAQTWVFKGLMLLLGVSFGIWGIGDIFHGNPLRQTVAKAGDDKITVQQLNSEFEKSLIHVRQISGQEITATQAKQRGVLDQSLDNIIERSIIDQQTNSLGLDVNAKALIARLAEQPQFRDKDGNFNASLFRQLLAQQHLTEDAFLEQGRQDIVRRQLIDVLQNINRPSALIVDTLSKALGQKRFFDIIEIKNAEQSIAQDPKEATLNDFYQKNQALFTAPEYRTMTIALLTIDSIAQDISIHDEDITKEYEAKGDQYTKPERRDLIQVLFSNEQEAIKFSEAAKTAGSLEQAAKAIGHNITKLDQTSKSGLLPELVDPVFALHAGQISAPIKSSFGWHIVELKKIFPSEKRSFQETKNEIRDQLKHDQAIESVTRMVNQLDDDLAAGHSLEDIADNLKLRLVKIPAADSQGRGSNGKTLSDIPYKEDVLKTVFSQSAGEVSPVMEDHKGNYYVVRTDDIVGSSLKPYDKVKTEVLEAWKSSEQARLALDKAHKIAQDLRDGHSLDSFNKLGVEVRTSKAISVLGDKDPLLPASFVPQLLKLNKGEVITTADKDKQYVFRLSKVLPADPAEEQNHKTKILPQLNKQLADELLDQYIVYLRSIYPVQIYQDVVETIRQQGS